MSRLRTHPETTTNQPYQLKAQSALTSKVRKRTPVRMPTWTGTLYLRKRLIRTLMIS